MKTSDLTSLISALRSETRENSISPEYLGSVLQSITDRLATAAASSELEALQTAINSIANSGGSASAVELALQTTVSEHTKQISSINSQISSINTQISTLQGSLKSTTTTANTNKASIASQQSQINSILNQLTTINNAIANMGSGSSSGGTTTVVQTSALPHIECNVVKDELYVKVPSSITAAGYKPIIFRYTRKRNNIKLDAFGINKKGDYQKGWHIFQDAAFAKIGTDYKVSFRKADKTYSALPSVLVNEPIVKKKTDGSVKAYRFYFGQGHRDVSNWARFRFAIGFAKAPDKDKAFDFNTLQTSLAEFQVKVACENENDYTYHFAL